MSEEGREARPVGGFALLALGVNGIIGVGIFFVPAELARDAPGWSSVLVFALTGLALSPVALAFAILGRRFHADGGPVVYARAAFGETASFLVGWIAYVSAVTSTAAVMAGLAGTIAPTLGLRGAAAERAATLALATLIALYCATGIRPSARAWTALTVLKLVPLAVLAGAFLAAGAPGAAPAAAAGGTSWLRSALRVVFTFQGFEIVPVIASQVRSPARSIPAATLGSLGVAALVYLALQSICVRALPHLAASASPLVDAARVYGGGPLAALVGAGAGVSALGICLGMMVTTPRYLSSLAEGEALTLGLERMTPRGVPLRALGVTWLAVAALVLAGSRADLFDLAGLAVLVQYVVTALALGALAKRGAAGLTARHGWVGLPALLASLALVWGAGAGEFLATAAAVALGLLLRRGSARLRRPAPRGSGPLS